eukprot:CAMPEP_0198503096 /NCGR_PEP_ID=MMETSP1462-20131121/9704_1 /TAXON_ID=1333877 /ORGANISM="Brandtodinium nutriculum, Strain RCC3387" /LENGTH=60 /DNA_ID=CAMNT_0044232203 /DNA_START=35 /DNA_END=213 /DNA_ORIENTATION=+
MVPALPPVWLQGSCARTKILAATTPYATRESKHPAHGAAALASSALFASPVAAEEPTTWP